MALEKETVRLWLGIGIGAGAVAAAPWVLPVLAVVARPLLKAVIGQSLLVAERAREGLAHAGETLADVVAEVKSEATERSLAEQRTFAAAVAAPANPAGGGPRGEPN